MTSWRVPSWPKICCTMCPAGTVSGIGIGGLELVDTIRIVAGPERNKKGLKFDVLTQAGPRFSRISIK